MSTWRYNSEMLNLELGVQMLCDLSIPAFGLSSVSTKCTKPYHTAHR